ncbi:small nuclear ribonucleoprotein F-like [Acomys russatus]|uniref:small nuclear ribonucleoprotein F-like n=1 Tax=Acomys russatus TaxID=60746 RepID=UPI0021E2860A|nr:small nuclear ribonucleoprotein F-like [Acomys russatus]
MKQAEPTGTAIRRFYVGHSSELALCVSCFSHEGQATTGSAASGVNSSWVLTVSLTLSHKPFLQGLTERPVMLTLEWEMGYEAYLVFVNGYRNMQLANTGECIDGALSGHPGEVLIRCNNVLCIRGIEEEEEDEGIHVYFYTIKFSLICFVLLIENIPFQDGD